MTLVLDPKARAVRTLWSLLSVDTPAGAVEALREREGVPQRNVEKHIGLWTVEQSNKYPFADLIAQWAQQLRLDAVVWTALGFKHFDSSNDERPLCPDVVRYLGGLRHERQRLAEEYVRRAPRQIDTEYRRAIAKELGWSFAGETGEFPL